MQLDLKRLDVAIDQADGVAIFVAAGEHDIAEQVHATARVGQAERVRQPVDGAHVVDVFCERKLGISMPGQANSKH